MANKRKKYTSNTNKYYRKKKSSVKKSETKDDSSVIENIDLAIDKLLNNEMILKDNTKIDEIEINKVEPCIPEENNLIEIKPDDNMLEENLGTIKDEQEILIPYIPVINEDDSDTKNDICKENLDTSENEKKSVSETTFNGVSTDDEPVYKQKKVKRYLGYNERLLINVVGVILFFVIGLVLVISSIAIKKEDIVLYNQSSNIDYKVYLKPNDYYKTPYLDKNMQYIANLIDDINVNFNYNFSVNQNINYKYSYYIKADVDVTDSQDKTKIIYSKSDKLTEPVFLTKENSNGFNINQNIKINYDKYNDLAKSFKSSYAISANSNLTLSLCIQILDEKGNMIRSYESGDAIKLKIPLTEQMIDITMDSKSVNNNNNNVSVYKDFFISNKITFIIAVVSFAISLGFTIRLLLFLSKTTVKKNLYEATLSKILREYDRVIVNSKKGIDLDNNKEVIDVNNFTELLDVRDNLEKPIIFYEIHKGQKSIFIVKTSNETYRYILKLADLEKEVSKKKSK